MKIIPKKIKRGDEWKKVLLEIYSFAPNSYGRTHNKDFKDDNHILAQTLKISGEKLWLSINFLKDNNLISETNTDPLDKINADWNTRLTLTKQGFKVAFEVEKQIEEETFRIGNYVLYVLLVGSTIFSMFISLAPETGGFFAISFLILIISMFIIMFIQFRKRRIF